MGAYFQSIRAFPAIFQNEELKGWADALVNTLRDTHSSENFNKNAVMFRRVRLGALGAVASKVNSGLLSSGPDWLALSY